MFGQGSRTIAFDANIKEYLKEIDEAALLTAEQEQELGMLVIEENDPLARERLVRSNLRLVVNIAKKYSNRGMSLGDLIEEGNLGLIKAVDYYNPQRGTRFSTYAAWWIKQGIKRSLLTNVQPVHVPTYMVALINQWRRMASELESRLGRAPEIEEIAEVMGLGAKKAKVISEVVGVLSNVKNTDVSEDGNREHTIGATLADKNLELPEEEMEADEEKTRVMDLLDDIDPREAEVLRRHYGLNGTKSMSLKEIGEELGLTRERIRQIQRTALHKLYEYMHEE